MRSKSNDFFSTVLMLIPLVAVPMLAIFGIPEIAPVKKSSINENDLFDSEGSSRSQFEEISFDSSSHEIDLGGEGNLSGQSRSNQNRGDRGGSFEKMASSRKDALNREDWLPPAGALEGWELEEVPSQLNSDQKSVKLKSAGSLPKFALDKNPIQQAAFEEGRPSSNSVTPIGQEIRQVENEGNPFEPSAQAQLAPTEPSSVPARQAAVKEVDQQFRIRAETMLRRDPATWSAAVQKLNDLGIRDYRLEPGVRPNEFLFSCSYSPPNNPRISRRFEAEALDPLKAVIKVLQQVDEWSRNK
ncbi:MAG: hypothetical protein K0U82_06140 [Planctomycetes bacterium]|nr:hypothetical protein [Planctomycetota bacterium]